jgi:hypothetical protein
VIISAMRPQFSMIEVTPGHDNQTSFQRPFVGLIENASGNLSSLNLVAVPPIVIGPPALKGKASWQPMRSRDSFYVKSPISSMQCHRCLQVEVVALVAMTDVLSGHRRGPIIQ